MKITPETKTLATIFQFNSDNKYLIPVYQRNYSWKDEQIETLFDDILAEDTGYYVGNLLINSDNGDNNVIDGQQRLTTLSLMLLATYEKLSEYRKEMDNTDPSLDKLIQTQSDIKRQLLFWKDAISPTDRGKAEEIQIENVHKLGNLTLTPYNSEMGNRSFEEKKNLTIDGKLGGLSLVLFLNESIDKNQNIFGINELQNRQEILESKIEELFLLK